jgi:hypothetical protein
MEPITTIAITTFLAPYLKKAGEKVAEKTVETLFDSRKDLAEKFFSLFKSDIISLGLSDSPTIYEIEQQLELRPQVQQVVGQKIVKNQDLLQELIEAFRLMPQEEFTGITINAKNIGAVIHNPRAPITLNNKFS